MNKNIIGAFLVICSLLYSCTSLIYTNKFNKRDTSFKLKPNDTVVIGTIIYNDLSISKKYTDSIYYKLKRINYVNLIHPDSIKFRLQTNKIYALPTIFPQELCDDLYKILKVRYYLNSFILIYNEADFEKNGEIQIQFDLYDLILRKIIWSCNSSVAMLVPEKNTNSGIDFRGIASIDAAFDKLLRKVIDSELKK